MPTVSRHLLQRLTRQRWLSLGVRRHLAARFSSNGGGGFETDLFGLRYRGRFDSYIDREVFFFGAYDRGTLTLIERLARQRTAPVFLDIGANVGQHTLASARHFSEIHAFEPYPPLVEDLRNHVSINNLRSVVVHPLGLGDEDAVATYAAPADDRAGYGGFDNHDPNLAKFQLPMRRADTYLTEQHITRADVVKIDVEGSERRVLKGMRGFLSRARPAIVFEFWPQAWSDGIDAGLPERYRHWKLMEQTSRLKILGAERLSLVPSSRALDGDTIVALPEEWPVPEEVTC